MRWLKKQEVFFILLYYFRRNGQNIKAILSSNGN